MVKEFIDVSYEFEDMVDEAEYEHLKQQSMGKVKKSLTKGASNIISTWRMSRTLKRLLDKVSSKSDFYEKHYPPGSNSAYATSITTSFGQLHPDEFLGRDADVENIVISLTETRTPNKFKVVAIIGVGGVDKADLAKCIYNRHNNNINFWT